MDQVWKGLSNLDPRDPDGFYKKTALKWLRPSALPLVVGEGGSLWTLTQKSTFPNEFGDEVRATDKVI